ncbi:AAA family ATPase [Clostridium botulinum]|nr:AAA family ATPase [Clostridium botulinum]MCS4516628.1 AAA family ATPase [Clostridium botulinum]
MSGPNGYGKTTLMDSIEWCLTGTIKRVYDDYMKRCSQKQRGNLKILQRD